ncbi:MAG: hypothetical protein IPO15_20770 [Anaerolineae bacterium]|uniref:hypothetical protein n=1 Tax=Candidatus Amarolinea dominans TaxID=3140696 RepID=UPI0031359F2A|nr:hypothetical protein [Anaerolineae bacterium]
MMTVFPSSRRQRQLRLTSGAIAILRFTGTIAFVGVWLNTSFSSQSDPLDTIHANTYP